MTVSIIAATISVLASTLSILFVLLALLESRKISIDDGLAKRLEDKGREYVAAMMAKYRKETE